MKKLICILLLFICIFCLSACGTDKTPITSEDFISYFEEKDGFEVFDRGIENGRYNCVIEADSEDGYDVFLYVYKEEYQAEDDFPELVDDMDDYFTDNKSSLSVSLANYEKVAYSDSDKYSVISRIGNTIVHTINVPKDYQEEVKGYLESLGY